MYKDYYHLQTDPFSTHPSTDTFFISETHKEAWYYLLFGIDTQEPFLLLTGEYGMGKTLLCLRLIKVLKEKEVPRVLYIPTSNEGYGGILRRIAASLGISTTPEDEEILQDMIYDRFRADTEKSRFYLIIDDAHELDTTILTKLKYLSTFSHNEFFPLIMIFVGHPSFLQDLRTPALSSLNQRIKRRCHLDRFNLEDTKNYIYFRLMKSGATGIPAFSDEAILKIFEYSGGVPRLINNICDTCLLIGASKQLISISPAVVDLSKNLVDGSLTGTKAEAKTDSDSTDDVKIPADDAKASITFSEDLPEGYTAKQASVFSTADTEEYQPEIARPKVSIWGGLNLKKAVTIAVVAILLILAVAALYRFFMSNNGISNIFSPSTPTAPQNTPVQSEPAAVVIPALRDELTDKPSAETPIPPVRTESMSYPFSLRSSSYQQMERAVQEISEIKQLGLTPYLVKSDLGDMGTWWRIYVGFYSTEEEAKKIKTTYKLDNATVQKTEYACQVGEFSNEADGVNIFEKLKEAGYSPYAIQKGRNLFRLYLGAYEKQAEAEVLYRELQKKGIKSQVVKR
jgi:type II secretory pathway predicted ATPase ExeA/cell division septation protein DedD